MLVSGCPTAGPRCSAAEASCTATTSLPASSHAQRRSSRPLPARALVQHAAGASSISSSSGRSPGNRGRTLRTRAAEVSSDMQQPQSLGGKAVPTADTWELDFCSRPILDERGKKLWELIICDPTRSFEYSQYFPNNRINSTQVSRGTAMQFCGGGRGVPTRACAQTNRTLQGWELRVQGSGGGACHPGHPGALLGPQPSPLHPLNHLHCSSRQPSRACSRSRAPRAPSAAASSAARCRWGRRAGWMRVWG